jgi:hypothetical protein
MKLLHIQRRLRSAHDRIVDQTALACFDQRCTFDIDQLASALRCLTAVRVPLSQLLRVVGHDPALGLELVNALERRISHGSERMALFPLLGQVRTRAHASHDPRQSQALTDQRHQNHAEGDEDDQVAVRERRAAGDRPWEGQGSGERHRAP